MASKKPKEALFPNDYWERPLPSTNGDLDQTDLFAAIGQALTRWEMLEESLESLCMVFSGLADDAENIAAFRRLFGSIESSSGRRSAIVSAAEVYFWGRDKDNSKMSRLNALLDIGAFLIPARYNSGRNKPFAEKITVEMVRENEFPFQILSGLYRYNSINITEISHKFDSLNRAILSSAWIAPVESS
jgi:hypothetical protein